MKDLILDNRIKILEQQVDNEMQNIKSASELNMDKRFIEYSSREHERTKIKLENLRAYHFKTENFYMDDLLFINGSETALKYQIVVDYIKDFFIENGTEITPFALCMGIAGKKEVHQYKAIGKLRLWKNVHGDEPSHGLCPPCLDYHLKKLK